MYYASFYIVWHDKFAIWDKILKTIVNKPQKSKTSQDNNLNYIHFLNHFYEYHTEKLKYRDLTCLILKVFYIVFACFVATVSRL